MISRIRRINAFIELGKYLTDSKNHASLEELAVAANRKNNWFTVANVTAALGAIGNSFLDANQLNAWVQKYPEAGTSKKVGAVLAGNIPAVGFHDVLSILISGHTLLAKTSSDDAVLLPRLLELLTKFEPGFADHIRFVERLNDADAFIATGSDNTARYFHYYFGEKPHVIRKNRTSVAVLSGDEYPNQLQALATDMLQYYGLGCRNVSKLYVPEDYEFSNLYQNMEGYTERCTMHHKYFNNYEYNRSVLLINRTPHLDNGFLMFTEQEALVSPISVIYYETYRDRAEVKDILTVRQDKIQCVVSCLPEIADAVPFGSTQKPSLYDYADGVDTMTCLSQL
jgi:hypothetical protein